MGTPWDFTGRRVLVAGGSRGIGRAIALEFARAGATVSICARGAEALEATRSELAAAGGGAAHAMTCDLGDAARIDAWVAEAARVLGGVDVLVNNASAFGDDSEDGWGASFGVDVMAVVRASRAAQPWLEQGVSPSILNISSISALKPSVRTPSYGAAKAAVVHYTTTQAAALARKGIRVNCIAPGSIEFPGGLWEERRTRQPELYARTLASIPFGRFGTDAEIAEVAAFLASDAARWVTGQIIAVDGGQTLGA